MRSCAESDLLRPLAFAVHAAASAPHGECATEQRQCDDQPGRIDLRRFERGCATVLGPVVRLARVPVTIVLIRTRNSGCAEQQYRDTESSSLHGDPHWLANKHAPPVEHCGSQIICAVGYVATGVGDRPHQVVATGVGVACTRSQIKVQPVFAESHAAAAKHSVITLANTTGTTKKYLQLRIVTAAKQMTRAHAGPRTSAKVFGARPPSCHANTAANTRNTETKRPNPT
jgi:hypothetical protein